MYLCVFLFESRLIFSCASHIRRSFCLPTTFRVYFVSIKQNSGKMWLFSHCTRASVTIQLANKSLDFIVYINSTNHFQDVFRHLRCIWWCCCSRFLLFLWFCLFDILYATKCRSFRNQVKIESIVEPWHFIVLVVWNDSFPILPNLNMCLHLQVIFGVVVVVDIVGWIEMYFCVNGLTSASALKKPSVRNSI